MTALLEQIAESQQAKQHALTTAQAEFILAVRNNTIPSAEAGQEQMQALGLAYEQIEAGCKLCDQRHEWAERLANAKRIAGTAADIQAKRAALDADFEQQRREYEAKRLPLTRQLEATEIAARDAMRLENKLRSNPLPHITAENQALAVKRERLAREVRTANEQIELGEATGRTLQRALESAERDLEHKKGFSAEGQRPYREAVTQAKADLARHENETMPKLRERAERARAEFNATDLQVAKLDAAALLPWPIPGK